MENLLEFLDSMCLCLLYCGRKYMIINSLCKRGIIISGVSLFMGALMSPGLVAGGCGRGKFSKTGPSNAFRANC